MTLAPARNGARLGAALLALGLALTACGGQDGDSSADDVETVIVTETAGADSSDGPTDSADPTDPTDTTSDDPSTTSTPTAPYTGTITPDELEEDLNAAVTVTDRYWTDHWSEFFRGTYTAPNVIGLYDGYDEANAPTCFGEALPPDNAFYCPDGNYVAWDQSLIARGFEVGDAWPYLIVAHEWGHAIQAQLQMSQQAVEYELQADCLAGAALYGSAADGNLEFEEGDEKEIVDSLNFIADETPWTMSGDHGDSFQRIDAFNRGRSGGVAECLPENVMR